MKHRSFSILLAAAMVLSLLAVPAAAVEPAPNVSSSNPAEHWFYDQLTDQGKAIYNAMYDMYKNGTMASSGSYDLASIVGRDAIVAYLNGNRTLFNDFAAAKDAFDLEHPEVWYMDSSYLSFRVTSDTSGNYHAYIGPGRAADYYVKGATANNVRQMTQNLETAVDRIVSAARTKGSVVQQVRYVHEQITKNISYRFETECTSGNEGYIRTAYALVTHEGVCEGYARSFQYILNKLGIPCVLIHGVQASGVPEDHMWTAVRIDGSWYVVDPTWDDPVPLKADGTPKKGSAGLDGGETETYLLVGQDVTAKNWQPSGYVSTGTMEFTYPDIALISYGTKAELDQKGLTVVSSEAKMGSVKATQYEISFNGMGIKQSADKGYYFLVKMYDLNADGSMDVFDDWYYPVHMLHALNKNNIFDPNDDFKNTGNKDFYDTDKALIMVVSQCEYVEFAVTTAPPPAWKSADDLISLGGYYSGNGSDILAESGLICNINGGYEAPPYVKNVSPLFNTSVYVGVNYTIHMEFTDPLYKPTKDDLTNALPGKEGDLEKALAQLEDTKGEVILDYVGTTYSWGVNARMSHTFANKPKPTNITYLYDTSYCKHNANVACSLDLGCRIYGLEYDFSASKMWADDSIQYEFSLTGLVGTMSNKFPSNWSYVFENPSAHCSYRYQGIDWNLWGQPQLLDNPNDLDLSKIALEGVSSSDAKNLEELRSQMHLDDQDMNGRLMLVVEDLSGSRSSSEELSQAISDAENIDVPAKAIKSSSMYEIDFARICQKTVVQTGQSLRLSIGFPPGFDASMEGITFKAYHFTRDIEGSCDIKTPGHVHTGLVTSVQEIPITVTQYGLVLLCNSFSPFEIVAIDTNIATGVKDTSMKDTVTLVNDGNGTVAATIGGTPAKDTNGSDVANMVQFKNNETVTFKVTPAKGYELDTVTLSGGEAIKPSANGTFTLTYKQLHDADSNGNAILSVTFAPKTIKAAEKQAGETVETPIICSHANATGGVLHSATCTTDGYITQKYCPDCEQVLSEAQTIVATGHIYNDYRTRKDVTCTTDGEEYAICSVCRNEVDIRPIPATGHSFVYHTVIKPKCLTEGLEFGICSSCDATETRAVPATGHSFVYQAVDPATCTKDGLEFGECSDCDATGTRVLSALGHDYRFGKCTRCGEEDPNYTGLPFIDVPLTSWYFEDVLYVYERGLMTGDSDTIFSPETITTRAQIVTILWRLSGSPILTREIDFKDVPADTYYTNAVKWAQANDIVNGSNGLFRPNAPLTREQLVTILYRYVNYRNRDVSASIDSLDQFQDAASVHDWAADAVLWACGANILQGNNGKLFPLDTTPRSQVAALMHRICEQYGF